MKMATENKRRDMLESGNTRFQSREVMLSPASFRMLKYDKTRLSKLTSFIKFINQLCDFLHSRKKNKNRTLVMIQGDILK